MIPIENALVGNVILIKNLNESGAKVLRSKSTGKQSATDLKFCCNDSEPT